jgi:hypothetical protein
MGSNTKASGVSRKSGEKREGDTGKRRKKNHDGVVVNEFTGFLFLVFCGRSLFLLMP